ncbi:hypothetical protein ANSO36C_53910 [Nostoc cf. commune SO-36]|uniref:Uncharacterized protein n=1 Tax=Nostoc cf. commune SO-36 TaxID=449208 RepID=A0ABM7Z8P8_NOSCO|nr:hypothetical protein [Nostoc commune]BDI19589.1 hypothetical protein ANSO36C_53910 [Nostoc cf. commune SO-36]
MSPSTEEELQIYRPHGDRFLTFLELDQQRQQETQRAEQAQAQLEALRTLLQEKIAIALNNRFTNSQSHDH